MNRSLVLGASLATLSLALLGCPSDHGHDHDTPAGGRPAPGTDGAGIGAPAGTPMEQGGDMHADDEHALGTLTLAGATLDVHLLGAVTPNAEVHFDIDVTAGAPPAALRVWIGVESGVGALKSLADGHDAHFHAHAEAPAAIGPDVALWIEAEAADGTVETGSLALPK